MTSIADLATAIISPRRQLGPYSSSFALPAGVTSFSPIKAQCTIKEAPIDELETTRHPVEQGASISDHAFKLPALLILELGWSNSGFQSLVNDLTAAYSLLSGDGTGGFNYVQEIYKKLLAIQLSRVPINVSTGKRKYSNMWIKRIMAPTTNQTENAIIITLYLEEAIVAQTIATTFTDSSVQANPQSTAAVQNSGTLQPTITAYQLNADGSIGQQVGIHD